MPKSLLPLHSLSQSAPRLTYRLAIVAATFWLGVSGVFGATTSTALRRTDERSYPLGR